MRVASATRPGMAAEVVCVEGGVEREKAEDHRERRWYIAIVAEEERGRALLVYIRPGTDARRDFVQFSI